jgi:polysaccharide biosynthesis transport protein
MRKDITIKLESSGTANRPGAFRIGYQGSEPAVVAQVANRLTNLYVEENLKTRELQAEGTSEFLETQLHEAKKRLDELEAAISIYKLKHNGELPQQENSLNGALSRLQVELEANRDAINRAEQTRVILGNGLNLAEANVAAQMRPMEAATGAVPEARTRETQAAQPARPARKKSEVLEEQLGVLQARYSAEHPEVIRMRRDIDRLKRTEEQEPATAPAAAENIPKPQQAANQVQPPASVRDSAELMRLREQVATLKAQIKVAETEVEDRKTEQRRILRDLSSYQNRMERLPVREQEMAQITRDYEISKSNYKSLLDKKIAAAMATDMERRQKSERFTILDPAKVPEKPVKPKRPLLYGIGSAVGLMLALVVGVVLELRQNVILGEWELPPDTPVLARLPSIQVPVTVRHSSHNGRRSSGVRTRASINTVLTLGVTSAIVAGLSYIALPI